MDTLATAADVGTIRPLIDSFKRHLRAVNRSPRTTQGYEEACLQLQAFLQDRGMPTRLESIRREHVEAFIEHLVTSKSPATAANRFRSLQQFWKWCVDEGEVTSSPMAKMRAPHVPEPLTPVLKQKQMTKLLKTCAGNDFEDRRDSAIISLFYDAGLRLAELAGLRWDPEHPENSDVFLNDGYVRVLGKGSRLRLAPIGARTVKALDRYLRVRDQRPDRDLPSLWLGLAGRMTDSGIAQMLRRRGREAGIPGLHPHAFRHSAAHAMLASGMTEGDVQRVFGWSSPQMLRRYGASAASERAIASHRKHSPLDRL